MIRKILFLSLLFLFFCGIIQLESSEIFSKISFTEHLNLNAINCSLCSIEFQILQANQIINQYQITNSDLSFSSNRNHTDKYFTVKIRFLSVDKMHVQVYFNKNTENCLFRVIRRNGDFESEADRFIEPFYQTNNGTMELSINVKNKTANSKLSFLPNSIVSINCSTTKLLPFPLLIIHGIHKNRTIKITKDPDFRFLHADIVAKLTDHNRSISCEILGTNEMHRKTIKIIHPPKPIGFDVKYLNFAKPKYSFHCLKDVGYPMANIKWDYNNSQSLFILKGNKLSVKSTAKDGSMIHLRCKAKYKSPIDQTIKSLSTKYTFLIQNSNIQKEQSENYVIIFGIMIAAMIALIIGSIWFIVNLFSSNSPKTKHEENEEPLIYEAPCNLIRPNALDENNSIFSDRSNSFPLEIQRTNSQYHRSAVNNIK